MVRPEVLRKRIDRIRMHLEVLGRLRAVDRETFVTSPVQYGAAERFLQLAIESINDMGAHVVAERGLGPIDRYRDIADAFNSAGWIDAPLHDAWLRMIGFRNILVHDYLNVDRHLVYDVLQDNLGDVQALSEVFTRFL